MFEKDKLCDFESKWEKMQRPHYVKGAIEHSDTLSKRQGGFLLQTLRPDCGVANAEFVLGCHAPQTQGHSLQPRCFGGVTSQGGEVQ